MGAASSEKTLHLKSAGPQAQGHITPSDPPGTRPSQHPRGLQKPLRQLTGSEGTFSEQSAGHTSSHRLAAHRSRVQGRLHGPLLLCS